MIIGVPSFQVDFFALLYIARIIRVHSGVIIGEPSIQLFYTSLLCVAVTMHIDVIIGVSSFYMTL